MAKKFDLEYIKKEGKKYSEWEEVEIEGSDGALLKFKIQKYVSNVEASLILENFTIYLEKFANKLYEDDNMNEIQKIMITLGHLNCFVIRYKTDIYTSKKQNKIEDNMMFKHSVALLSMPEYKTIISLFNKSDIDRVRDEFLSVLETLSSLREMKGKDVDVSEIKSKFEKGLS